MTIVQRFQDNPLEAVVWVLVLLASVVLHEYGHASAAIWQGDDTPAKNGRFDWNPFRYLDWVGVALFVLIGFGALGFVRTQPWKYRNPVLGSFVVSIAGIVMNLALAFWALVALRIVDARAFTLFDDLPLEAAGGVIAGSFSYTAAGVPNIVLYALAQFLSLNIILAVFNALPVPPLDGAHALAAIVPGPLGASLRANLGNASSWVILILVVVLLREPLWNLIYGVERVIVETAMRL